jgi:hypothetical protein
VTWPDAWLDPLRLGPVCFDTTVPRHFVTAGSSPILINTFAGRARWSPAVEAELRRAPVGGVSALVGGVFAQVVNLDPGEDQDAEDLRLTSLTRAERRVNLTKNRGEAECVVICERLKIPLVVHDEKGREWARLRGVKIYTAVDVLYAAVRSGVIKPAAAWRAYERICGEPDAMFPVTNMPPDTTGHRRFMAQAEPLCSLLEAERSRSA